MAWAMRLNPLAPRPSLQRSHNFETKAIHNPRAQNRSSRFQTYDRTRHRAKLVHLQGVGFDADAQQPDSAGGEASTSGRSDDTVACYGTGSEAECIIPDDAPQAVDGSASEGSGFGSVLDTLLLISPFFFWGTSMVAMKQVAPHTTPLFVAAFRLVPAGILLVAWASAQGRKQPSSLMAWVAVVMFGLVDAACFQGFLAEGLQRTSAGLGSVIIDSQPLTVALLASLLFGEQLGTAGYGGLLIGIAGLCLLEVPPEALTSLTGALPAPVSEALPAITGVEAASTTSGSWSLWDSGEWWMLLAAQSMAVGTVMVRWVSKYVDPVMATGWHMILGGIPLVALSFAREGEQMAQHVSELTGFDALLLLYVSLLGSAASYGVFFYNASRGNLTALSSLTFLTPMFAAGAGYLALGETLTPLQLTGAAVTLGAVALISGEQGQKKQT